MVQYIRARCLLSTIVLVCVVLVFSAISASARDTITFIWHGSSLNSDMLQAIKEFEESTGITVDVELGSNWKAHYEKLMLRWATGESFDVAVVDGDIFGPAVEGVFADLTPFMKRDDISEEAFSGPALDTFRALDGIYALPNQIHTIALQYNPHLFDIAGLAYPTTDWTSAEWTWDEFVDTAKKLTRDLTGDGVIDQIGISGLTSVFIPWWWGGDWTNDEASASQLTSPEVVRALQEFADLVNVHGVMPGAIEHALPPNAFQAGRAGMEEGPTWGVRGTWSSASFLPGLAVLPKGTDRKTILYADGFAMGSNSKNKDMAWEFIKHFTAEEKGAWEVTLARGSLPALRTLQSEYISEMGELMPTIPYQVFIEGLEHSKILSYRKNLNASQVGSLISQARSEAISGEKSALQALTEIHDTVDRLLKEGFVEIRR